MKVALGVEYFGKNFHGWQIQKSGLRTVQSEVESALSEVANHPVRVFCSGRTDAGVHAVEQLYILKLIQLELTGLGFLVAMLTFLVMSTLNGLRLSADDFHARFSAFARSYQYKIHHHPVRSSLKADYYLWEPRALNVDDMRSAAALLLGEHDFSCFRGSLCQAKSPIKTIDHHSNRYN